MSATLKPLNEQVVLITGASSGIGRRTAERFAAKGAKVILIARGEEGLRSAVREIEAAGSEATYAVADVADMSQFRAAAEAGVARFGRIDTWVNDAGVGMYTKLLESDIRDDRRLFETNFWGIVNGSRLAMPYLLQAGGGSLINLGSEVSDQAIPLQGMYSASKHAIMGFTNALREEVYADHLPVYVTLIKPAGINTPFTKHAKNYMDVEPTLPAPVYAVDIVADQILHAAVHGDRELYAGGGGRLIGGLGKHFPGTMEMVMSKLGVSQQKTDRAPDRRYEGLHSSKGYYKADGEADRDRYIRKTSVYGTARRHPVVTAGVVAASVAAVGLLLAGKMGGNDE